MSLARALGSASFAIALAMSPPAERAEADAPSVAPPTTITGFHVDGTARNRWEHENWFTPETQSRNTTFDTVKLQAGVGYRDPLWDAYVQGQFFGGWNVPDTGAGTGAGYFNENGHSDFADLGIRQVNVALKQSNDVPVTLRGGRMLYSSGEEVTSKDASIAWLQANRIAQRLIGVSDFGVGRSFDGGRIDRSDGASTVTLACFHPTQGGNQANINPTITDVDIGTAAYTYTDESTFGQVFYYFYGDDRGTVPTDNRPLDVRQEDLGSIDLHTFGGSVVKTFDAGRGEFADIVLWGAGQNGNWGGLSHHAYAGVIEVGYQFRDAPWQPWIRAGWNSATGDGDGSDGTHSTFSQLIPTARRYALTPFYNMQNMNDVFIQAVFKPNAEFKIRPEVHYLQLTDRNDLLYSGAGPNDRAGRFGMSGIGSGGRNNVGVVTDVDLTYQFNRYLATTLYLGYLFPGGVPRNSFPAGRENIIYGFLDLNLKF